MADVIITEAGAGMDRFPDVAHLVWRRGARVCPGNNESAGKRFSGRTRKGQRVATDGVARRRLGGRPDPGHLPDGAVSRLSGGIGNKKAAMAVADSILVIAYHLLADAKVTYTDLGPDWFARRNNRGARESRLVKPFVGLGYEVGLRPAA